MQRDVAHWLRILRQGERERQERHRGVSVDSLLERMERIERLLALLLEHVGIDPL